MKLPEYFGKDGHNGYGYTHVFLTPAYNQINKPSAEDQQAYPNFGGYDQLPFDPNASQNFRIDYIVKYKLETRRKADPNESVYDSLVLDRLTKSYALYEDTITLYIFSPWTNEKNALNQAWTFMRDRYKLNEAESDPYIEHFAKFISIESLS